MSNAATNEVAVGLVLGETYEIVRLLGEGGMGTVWEARHLRLPGKRCAVKVLHGQATADQEAYARFRREAEIASRIGHPNIVEVLDWNTLPSGQPYLVLEFLEGEDLAARLANGPLPLDQALSIARQIGAALNAAHAAEVVHRDLKPANVFLVPRELGGEMVDHVKVLDFGISKIRNSQTVQTQDAVLLGTPQYMAPEQALGKNHEIDGRTDVFALAAIVYEMIAGQPCFQGSSLAEVVFKVVYEAVVPLSTIVPGIDPEVASAINRAMSKNAADRFPDVSAFITALTGRALAPSGRRSVSSGAAIPATMNRAAQGAESTGSAAAPSHLRGEMHARTEQAAKTVVVGGGRSIAFLAVAIVVGAVGTFGVVRFLKGDRAAEHAPVSAAASVPKAPVVEKNAEPPKVEAPAPKPAEHVASGANKKHEPAVAEPPEVKAFLDDAEAALHRGDGAQARLLADRSLRVQKTSRAYAITTRAHCLAGDLGNAKATWQHVASGDRARVRKDCQAHDIDLN